MKIISEYIWLDNFQQIRSKTRIDNFPDIQKFPYTKYETLQLLPTWNYDGSSTGQASTEDSEVLLKPVNYIKHPFDLFTEPPPDNKHLYHILVLCENISAKTHEPVVGNSRTYCAKLFEKPKVAERQIMFGLEQEFFFFDKATKQPLYWKGKDTAPQGKYYCGINKSPAIERTIMETLFKLATEANLQMSGFNQEVAPSQWEYQIGPVVGVHAGDQMIFAKYILMRLCEKHNLYPVFHPKPIKGNWNGSGCHINISSKATRENNNGLETIITIVNHLQTDHSNFIKHHCGYDNHERLTGKHETSSIDEFSYSIGGRNVSVRIPSSVALDNKGYFEDRRPGSNIDYYQTLGYYTKFIV